MLRRNYSLRRRYFKLQTSYNIFFYQGSFPIAGDSLTKNTTLALSHHAFLGINCTDSVDSMGLSGLRLQQMVIQHSPSQTLLQRILPLHCSPVLYCFASKAFSVTPHTCICSHSPSTALYPRI